MGTHAGLILPNLSAFRIALLGCLIIAATGVRGKTAEYIPPLIPAPQKVVWNNQKFCPEQDTTRLVKRIVSIIPGVPFHSEEAYSLKITVDSAVLTATTATGLFRGLQTIRQLTYSENGRKVIAGCSITDWPAFRVRGFMQDVGRNFMPLAMLKEQVDVMAAYKFNVFHLHLTDNPAWRLESKKYPQLHAASSMSRWKGQYYSQEDLTEIVNYCAERFITVIPELDVPGHCEAFRKAFNLDSMSDSRVQPILLDLVDELCDLLPPEKMPYLHLGTDEVWHRHERPAPGLLAALTGRARSRGREVIVWRPGQRIEGDSLSITQLWSSAATSKAGHRYIDCRLNYLNHLDPLAGITQLYFDRICRKAHGDSLALGGILCCWNDNNVTVPGDILAQNPVYPGMLTYSETSWKGQKADIGDAFLARIPSPENPLYQQYREFENRLANHRDLYFANKPFPFVRQTEIAWSMIGPFDNQGDANMAFPVENGMEKKYFIGGREYQWSGPYYGGTIHVNHFFGYPSHYSEKKGTVYAATNVWSPRDQEVGCWIGFHDWSRSAGRRGGPFPQQGQWHKTNPAVWLNGEKIEPPVWKNPGLAAETEEIPFSDENYFFREPARIKLKEGWNQVLLKIPQDGKSWKWMFTFVPVVEQDGKITEVQGLKYSVYPQLGAGELSLSPVFGEHMVFQKLKPMEIAGKAGVNDTVRVFASNNSAECICDPEGNWRVTLPPLPAGGPYVLKIFVNGIQRIDWKDILVGEVWLCSGQSNMAFRLDQSRGGAAAAASASDNRLRLMNYHGIAETSDVAWEAETLRRVNSNDFFEGSWASITPDAAAGFSAIGWYFGSELRNRLKVPVGLIQAAMGGAPVESFIDSRTMETVPELSNELADWYNNDLVMDWCRDRARKNISKCTDLPQRHPYMPSYVYNAAIAAIKDFPVRGVIWYQGESNTHNPGQYKVAYPAMVQSWRESWRDSKLPFIFAQLSSIQRPGWEIFRECQRRMAESIPGSAMVVTSDLGDSLNVHPIQKQEIGHRFALQAMQKVYGLKVKADGPLPLRATGRNDKVEVVFNSRSLGTSDMAPVRELEAAGADGVFSPAAGVISKNKIIVQTDKKNIRQVRYGWKPFSHGNLTGGNGLPASTFLININ